MPRHVDVSVCLFTLGLFFENHSYLFFFRGLARNTFKAKATSKMLLFQGNEEFWSNDL